MLKFISVIYTPAEIALLPERDLSDVTAVVIDVLRATSTIITGLANGAAGFYPVAEIEEAHALKQKDPQVLLAGERNGDPPPGFDFGNSPLEFTKEKIANRKIIHTTTNGTRAFTACRHAQKTIAAAFVNLQAVVDSLRKSNGKILLVCAGTFDAFSLEDAYCAGAIADALEIDHPIASIYQSISSSLIDALRHTRNGLALQKAGRMNDIEWCAKKNEFSIVPKLQKDGWIQ